MKSLSQKLFLVNLLLQLCLDVQQVVYAQPVEEVPLEFGDMLEFSNCRVYSHYAIYVDDVPINGKEPGQNIFEMTRNPPGCRFSTLRRNIRRTNHLDQNIQQQEMQEIINSIQNLTNSRDCARWSLMNNCEFIATSVRYGENNAQCNQEGTIAGPFCKLLTRIRNWRRQRQQQRQQQQQRQPRQQPRQQPQRQRQPRQQPQRQRKESENLYQSESAAAA